MMLLLYRYTFLHRCTLTCSPSHSLCRIKAFARRTPYAELQPVVTGYVSIPGHNTQQATCRPLAPPYHITPHIHAHPLCSSDRYRRGRSHPPLLTPTFTSLIHTIPSTGLAVHNGTQIQHLRVSHVKSHGLTMTKHDQIHINSFGIIDRCIIPNRHKQSKPKSKKNRHAQKDNPKGTNIYDTNETPPTRVLPSVARRS